VLSASAAHAVAAELPDEMIGKWCFDKYTSTEDEEHYGSVEDGYEVDVCGNHGGLITKKATQETGLGRRLFASLR
jgi:hypothetical protein